MRKLIRIMTGAALIGALVFVASPPALANHEDPANPGTNWPGAGGHEEMPNIAVANGTDVCVVQGGILATNPTVGGPQHNPAIPIVNDNPAHSHYAFVGQNSITCLLQGVLNVGSNGGNDGHMIDLFDPANPIGGANGDILEVDPVTNNNPQHDFNTHHGSTNESAWSHSSGYAGGGGGGPSNNCFGNANDNKANITANTSSGWLKYIRLGLIVDVWGCFTAGPLAGTHFSALILLQANPATPGAAFNLVGVAVLGNGWAIDTGP